MADNYLEKKMEDHRLRQSAQPRGKAGTFMRFRPGLYVATGALRVLLEDVSCSWSAAIIDAFRSAGCKLAFTGTDIQTGRHIAQKTGTLFYPGDDAESAIAYLRSHWGGLDALIVPSGADNLNLRITTWRDDSALDEVVTELHIDKTTADFSALGRFCVFICSESGRGLRGQIIKFS